MIATATPSAPRRRTPVAYLLETLVERASPWSEECWHEADATIAAREGAAKRIFATSHPNLMRLCPYRITASPV